MKWLAGIALLVLAFLYWPQGRVELESGIYAPDAPVQVTLSDAPTIMVAGYALQPLASFDLKAKVLSRERYRFDDAADLAPLDLALGWGRMSDEAVLQQLDIRQGNRWFFWQAKALPIPQGEISQSAANMHLIPADAFVKKQLLAVKRGQIVSLKGQLVEATRPGTGWSWRSSLSRSDTGGGACEVFYVEQVGVEIY